MKQSPPNYLLFGIIIFVVSIALVGSTYFSNLIPLKPSTTPQAPVESQSNTLTTTGTITELDTQCTNDGACRVKVDNYWITTSLGGDPTPAMITERGPKGSIYLESGITVGNLTSEEYLGRQVEVNVKKIDATTGSLYGNADYYIKVLE